MVDFTQSQTELRTLALLGDAAMERLHRAHVAVFGLGGVGGYTAETLARCGVGHLTLVDGDAFSPSNLNRQLFCTVDAVGKSKAQTAKERLATVAPFTKTEAVDRFLTRENVPSFDFSSFDYVVDAVDDLAAKIALALACQAHNVPLIAAMGAGNKVNATGFCVVDLAKTHTDPLAKRFRTALGKEGVRHLKTVCSFEAPRSPDAATIFQDETANRRIIGSLPFVVGAMGMAIAGEVVTDLCHITQPYAPYGEVKA